MFVLIFILAIAFFIMFHEFGHFATAKAFGMKCEKFFLGFGPTLWSVRRGETEYGIKAIPAGGFVKITGMSHYETYDPADADRTFHSKPAWQKIIVLSAGSASHFVLAALLLYAALVFLPIPVLEDGQPVPGNTVAVVVDGSPASVAGIVPGDEIVAVDRLGTPDFDGVRTAVEPRGGDTVALDIVRAGALQTLSLTLDEREGAGFLGVGPAVARQDFTAGEAVGEVISGEYSLGSVFSQTMGGLASVFDAESLGRWFGAVDPATERTADGPISLVGAGQVVDALGDLGEFTSIVLLLASLNIVLGTLNMLPLPPLDGGHVATVLVESSVNGVRRLRGQPGDWQVNPAKVTPIALAVILFFGLFTLTALYIDIVNPASQLLR